MLKYQNIYLHSQAALIKFKSTVKGFNWSTANVLQTISVYIVLYINFSYEQIMSF